MDRRMLLKGAAGLGAMAASGGLSRPAISQGAAAKTLRFVPQANLANFDPIWGTQYVVRNAAAMVWDTLYGFDSNLEPKPQMAESAEVSSDGLTWTFKLRPNLKFHDGTPVLAKDVVASLARWAVRDPMGQMIIAIQNELTAVDDRTVKWLLKKPYPKMLLALGKNNTPIAFIMPERIAKTDPFKQIDEYIGSGPMKFAKGEWVPGAKAVFEKFTDYVPRQEPASWLAGGKNMLIDRIEWIVMPDPATASSALQNGEVDWWENPISDLVPVLKKNRNISVDIADSLGNIGSFRMNHLHPPFNDVKVRRAVLMALDQEEYMRALVGDDNALWKPLPGFFTPDTPLYTESGGEILKMKNLAAAKKLLSESSYSGQPVTCIVAQDQPITKAQGDVTAELLKRLGMNVDFVATDWGTTGQRRAQKSPPGQGGWSMFHTWHAGADCISPAPYNAVRANGDKAWFGWPNSEEVEKEVSNWFDAKTLDEEKVVMARLNKAALDHVVYAPTGFFLGYQAWRKNVSGITKGPLPWFWGVSKSA
ncbi:dipeptide-binding protein DppE precursor [Variibacter gotjawalensis]|uniref:Dipeptide-binding protein DppE n=1 Tax=Variibacter gotjawalensis TaxID=1333996 RepID=A0A0S3PU64_9BRAD|nr:ABC transporter substrate-binding protein [Variibacter gotjawalensis]NIK49802.1 peptide/nickel transport system substrate-binding protein [Variibacter gotjawalensis]RZS45806.1 peptide/nickel transport system substrate-binding protein [Variibacter gotjawalensis]BAT59479.1 dipeptide-binding protein DppE precursor [Variibacter gotjawalensis]